MLLINLFSKATCFFPETLAPKHIHKPSTSLVTDFACKFVLLFKLVAANVNFASAFVCKCINVVNHCALCLSCDCFMLYRHYSYINTTYL